MTKKSASIRKIRKDKSGITKFAGFIIIFLILIAAAGIGYGLYWFFTKPVIEPPYVDPLLGDAITTVYNEQTARNVPINIAVRSLYDPDIAVIPGMDIYIFQYGTTMQEMLAADGSGNLVPNEAALLDSFSTDSSGAGTSNRNFLGKTLLTACVGLDSSANKSQVKDFVVQGLTQDTTPASVDCGIFFYEVMAEETACTWSWTDNQGATLTSWNYTADSDGLLEAKIKLVMSTSGQCLRDIFSRKYGNLPLMIAVKVTHGNASTSAAIDVESPYDDKGTPTNQLVFAFLLSEIIYEVDSTGSVEEDHESYRSWAVTLDFGGCGLTVNDTQAFTIGGWCLIEQDLDQPISAGLPSGDSASWFQDALATLTIEA